MKKHSLKPSGCLICGRKLVYSKNIAVNAKCVYCGREEETNTFCMKGHYVCNSCHGQDILTRVEGLCLSSDMTDPAALLLEVFKLPGLKMHGPEYHSIAPAVLVTAYNNQQGIRDPLAIKEAIRRGRDIKGGVCGSHGACGAGIGAGIAYSVISGATPYSVLERGAANRITSLVLLEISKLGGPRCCKRDSMTAVEIAKGNIEGFSDSESSRYICSQYTDNGECIGARCPYYPANMPLSDI